MLEKETDSQAFKDKQASLKSFFGISFAGASETVEDLPIPPLFSDASAVDSLHKHKD